MLDALPLTPLITLNAIAAAVMALLMMSSKGETTSPASPARDSVGYDADLGYGPGDSVGAFPPPTQKWTSPTYASSRASPSIDDRTIVSGTSMTKRRVDRLVGDLVSNARGYLGDYKNDPRLVRLVADLEKRLQSARSQRDVSDRATSFYRAAHKDGLLVNARFDAP